MGSKKVTLAQRQQIVALGVHTHIKKSAIARKVGVSTRTVFATLKRHQARGTVEDAPRSGRPRKTSSLEDLRIVRMARRYPSRGSKVIKREGHLVCSERTVRRRLSEGGLPRRIARHKPLLNPRHVAARLRWCQDHLQWGMSEWSRVIWSDERTFWLANMGECGYRVQLVVHTIRSTSSRRSSAVPLFKSGLASVVKAMAHVTSSRGQ